MNDTAQGGEAPAAPTPGDRSAAPMGGRLRAWLELCRAGNLPTILSNALVGWAIGTAAAPDRAFFFAAVAVALLYTAGMIFNDVCDARTDARERPRRPIPSGRVDQRRATIGVVLCLGSAMALLALTRQAAVGAGGVLIALIVAYDLLHGRSALTVLLMAACRAMVYIVVASAAPAPGGWPLPGVAAAGLAIVLGLYIAGLSLVARLEMTDVELGKGWRRAAPLALAIVPLLGLAAVRPSDQSSWIWSGAVAAVMVLWILLGARHALARPPRRGAAVSAWLSAIPLVDAFFLTLLDRPGLALIALACWPLTRVAQRCLPST